MSTQLLSKIDFEEFAQRFKYSLDLIPESFAESFEKINTEYKTADEEEIQQYCDFVNDKSSAPLARRTKEQNYQIFDDGWRENLEKIKAEGVSFEALKPGYFRGSKYFRYDDKLILPDNKQIEYDLFVQARKLIFKRYLKPFEYIYEFGCGSCANLLMLAEMFPEKKITGTDWVSSSAEIAQYLNSRGYNITGRIFDMLNPAKEMICEPGQAIITIHAMEQLGNNHEKFLKYVLDAKPKLVLNYEPVREFYNPENILDEAALDYLEKRNYLSGYYSKLKQLENEGKIEIIEAYRPYLGGILHEQSIICWKPIL